MGNIFPKVFSKTKNMEESDQYIKYLTLNNANCETDQNYLDQSTLEKYIKSGIWTEEK